jgi:hypothetical protein
MGTRLEFVRAAGHYKEDVAEGVVKNVLQVPHEIPTIQEALDISVDCDKITIAPGFYYESLKVRTQVTLLGMGTRFLPQAERARQDTKNTRRCMSR